MPYTNFNGKPLGFDDVVLLIQHCKDNDKSIKVTLTDSITRQSLDISILDIKINENNTFSVKSGEHANEEYDGIVFGDDVYRGGGGKTKKRRTRKSRKNKRKTRGRR